MERALFPLAADVALETVQIEVRVQSLHAAKEKELNPEATVKDYLTVGFEGTAMLYRFSGTPIWRVSHYPAEFSPARPRNCSP